jgi:hypothetical protein
VVLIFTIALNVPLSSQIISVDAVSLRLMHDNRVFTRHELAAKKFNHSSCWQTWRVGGGGVLKISGLSDEVIFKLW